jgi:hypothetical protein
MRVLQFLRIDDRFIDGAWAAFIKKSLDSSPEDFTAFVIYKLFQIVQGHSLKFSKMLNDAVKPFSSRKVGVSPFRFAKCVVCCH